MRSAPPIPAHTSLVVEPLTAAIGAVVHGLDATAPLPPAARRAVIDAVHEHQVVFVPGQDLTAPQLAAFAHQFGDLGRHPLDEVLGRDRAVSTIVDDAEHPPAAFDWHTDLSWTAAPPAWGVLHAIEIPPVGGDTLWASGRAMWAQLPAARRRTLLGGTRRHHPDPTLLATIRRHHGDAVADELVARHPGPAHPVVRRHPATGRPALWLSPLSTAGPLLDADGTVAVGPADDLDRAIDDPHVQVRWRWRVGDLVVWDETATVHRALGDHAPARRCMLRTTIAGTRPVGFSGRT